MNFKELNIIEPILKALKERNYETPTDIQKGSIPLILNHEDVLGCAQTGTGKTAAFAIPIIQNLSNKNLKGKKTIKALVLTPTRELAIQIAANFDYYSKYTGVTGAVIFGGVNQTKQVAQIRNGIDVLIATPGRLLDLISQKHINLSDLDVLVLDEADSMLDMGFIHDVKKIIKLTPTHRQTLLYSATMPKEIESLAASFQKNPKRVIVTPISSTVETVNQSLYYVDKHNKTDLLIHLLKTENIESLLVFTKTKHGANQLVKRLEIVGYSSSAIHGNKSQSAREKALNDFKKGKINILVATDIAARGIDIKGLSHVINFDLPNIPETYVHRIGRTGRANESGTAISFSNIDEKDYVKGIEKLMTGSLEVTIDHPYPMEIYLKTEEPKRGHQGRRNKTNNKSNNKQNKRGNKRYR